MKSATSFSSRVKSYRFVWPQMSQLVHAKPISQRLEKTGIFHRLEVNPGIRQFSTAMKAESKRSDEAWRLNRVNVTSNILPF